MSTSPSGERERKETRDIEYTYNRPRSDVNHEGMLVPTNNL